jgi:hypothetical protein
MSQSAASKTGRIDYSSWSTNFGAELRTGSGTNAVNISKICDRLESGEARITADAALELATALIEAAQLAKGQPLHSANAIVADLAAIVKKRHSGGPIEQADPAAVKTLDGAIREAAAAAAAANTQAAVAIAAEPAEKFIPG